MLKNYKLVKKVFSNFMVLLIIFSLIFTFQTQVSEAATAISYIDTSTNGRETMIVDGQPFFYSGVQVSGTRMHDAFGTGGGAFGWSWDELACTFNQAASDGYTVMAVPVCWRWVEPTKDTYNWSDVDSIIDKANSAGIKLEILWFGSDVCSKQEGNPSWVNDTYTHVKKSDGSDIYMVDGYPKMDKCDTNLLAEEKQVVTDMLNHIKTYQDSHSYPHVLVGIQLLNEPTVVQMIDWPTFTIPTPRSYSTFATNKWNAGGYTNVDDFNGDVMYDYLNGLGQAVKTSNYPIWTRVNYCGPTETNNVASRLISKCNANRATTNLDFVGLDPYVTSQDDIYNYVTGNANIYSGGQLMTTNFNNGTNLAMVMENGGDYTNTDKLMWNASAGDGRYHVWEFNDSCQNNSTSLPVSVTYSQQRLGEESSKAKDGNNTTRWSTPDLPSNNCSEWIKYDFGSNKTIDRYGICNDPNSDYVTRDWTVQYSTDNTTWYTSDIVTGNTSQFYNKKLPSPITARYIRLNITKCNKDGMAWPAVRIMGFDVGTTDFAGFGLYSTNLANKTIAPKSHSSNAKAVNLTLRKDGYDISRLKMGGVDATTFNRAFAQSSDTTATVGGKSIRFNTNGWASGMAMKRDANTYVFLCYGGSATITVPTSMNVLTYELGYYDSNNNWVKQSTCGRGSTYDYWVGSGDCLRITY